MMGMAGYTCSPQEILIWRLRAEAHGGRAAEDVEHQAMRLVTVAFFALAAYVGVRSLLDLVAGSRPEESAVRIGLAIVSLIVMRLLAWRKRAVARELDRLERREHSTRPVETGDETTYRRRSAPST